MINLKVRKGIEMRNQRNTYCVGKCIEAIRRKAQWHEYKQRYLQVDQVEM